MDTTRQQKFAKLIQKEISAIIQREAQMIVGKALVTVTEVRTTPDLGIARIYLSMLGIKEKEKAIEGIREKGHKLRGALGSQIRKQVRHVPELEFYLDESLDYAENIERLLKQALPKKEE